LIRIHFKITPFLFLFVNLNYYYNIIKDPGLKAISFKIIGVNLDHKGFNILFV
jgi:hypothetical protein